MRARRFLPTLRGAATPVALAVILACGRGGEAPPEAASGRASLGEDEGGPATAEVLVDSLKERGIAVKPIGISNPVWFSPKGLYFAMAGDNVQVFEYESADGARTDIGKVTATGDSVAGSTIPGKGPTRFYRRGRLIVLVQGDSDRLADALERYLGEPVAGSIDGGGNGAAGE